MKKFLIGLFLLTSTLLSAQVTARYGILWGNVDSTNVIDSIDLVSGGDSVALYVGGGNYVFYSSSIYAGDSSEFIGSGTYSTFPVGLRVGDRTNEYIRSIRETVTESNMVIFFDTLGFYVEPPF